MKNKILYILAASLAVFSACKKPFDMQNDPSLSISKHTVAFDHMGGSANIAVVANVEWTFTSDSWLNVELIDDNKLQISTVYNESTELKKGKVTITAKDIEKHIYVAQTANIEYTNLSADGIANSYISKTDVYCKIDAKVKGNGNVTAQQGGVDKYIKKYGVDIANVAYADVMWESTFNADKTSSCNIIEDKPLYIDGYIYFKVGTAEGNALVALFDDKGTVIWSWHIWVTNKEITLSTANTYEWMDRNLGALNNTPGDINNRGLFYQWGRKDPFLPASIEYSEALLVPYSTPYNTQKGDGVGEWDYGYYISMIESFPGNLLTAIQNPMTFLKCFRGNGATYIDWYIGYWEKNDDMAASNLWGNVGKTMGKTIFDPCPAGYTLPGDNAWDTPESHPSEDPIFEEAGENKHGKYWRAGTNDFLPYSGYMTFNKGAIEITGKFAGYWTKAPIEDSGISKGLNITLNKQTLDFKGFNRGYGFNVRCVKEK